MRSGVAQHDCSYRGSIRTMMVTGDYHHTALAVARGVGMTPMDAPLVIIQSQAEFRSISKGSVAMPSALKSPRAAPHAPLGGVGFRLKDPLDEEEAPESSVRAPPAVKTTVPALKASHRTVSFPLKDQPEEEAPEGSVATPSALRSSVPAFHTPHRAVSFPLKDQPNDEEAPEGSVAVPPALGSSVPALHAPHRAVSFPLQDKPDEEQSPEGCMALPSARKSLRLPPLASQASRRSVSFRIKEQPEEEAPPEGQLRFQLDNGDVFQDGDALRAFTSIAQVKGPLPRRRLPAPYTVNNSMLVHQQIIVA